MKLSLSPVGEQKILMPQKDMMAPLAFPDTPEIALLPQIFQFLGGEDGLQDSILFGSKGREILLGSHFHRSTEKSDIDFCTTYKGSEDDLRHWRKEILSFLRIEERNGKIQSLEDQCHYIYGPTPSLNFTVGKQKYEIFFELYGETGMYQGEYNESGIVSLSDDKRSLIMAFLSDIHQKKKKVFQRIRDLESHGISSFDIFMVVLYYPHLITQGKANLEHFLRQVSPELQHFIERGREGTGKPLPTPSYEYIEGMISHLQDDEIRNTSALIRPQLDFLH